MAKYAYSVTPDRPNTNDRVMVMVPGLTHAQFSLQIVRELVAEVAKNRIGELDALQVEKEPYSGTA